MFEFININILIDRLKRSFFLSHNGSLQREVMLHEKDQREVNHDGILSVIFKHSCLSWCRDSADYRGRIYWASMSLRLNFIGRSRSS